MKPLHREQMRINGTRKAPISNSTSEAALGVATIRAFKMSDRSFQNYRQVVDTEAKAFLFSNAAMEWFIFMYRNHSESHSIRYCSAVTVTSKTRSSSRACGTLFFMPSHSLLLKYSSSVCTATVLTFSFQWRGTNNSCIYHLNIQRLWKTIGQYLLGLPMVG